MPINGCKNMSRDELVNSTEIKNVLRSLGLEKIYIVDENLNCYLLLGFYTSKQYLILIAKGNYAWYSKIAPADVILEPYWRCSYVVYVPEGLYVFARTILELATKISKVLEKYQRYRT